MNVTVAFPFRGGEPERERSLDAVMKAYRDILLDAEQMIVDTDHETFNRAAARNRCVDLCQTDIIVIADSDILPNRESLAAAINSARETGGLNLAYDRYRALSKESTETWYNTKCNPSTLKADFETFRESTAGIIVMRRDDWIRAGGMDEGFEGYAYEDTAFAVVCRTFFGEPSYHEGTVNHLWHTNACKPHDALYQKNLKRYKYYKAFEGQREKMQRIIDTERYNANFGFR